MKTIFEFENKTTKERETKEYYWCSYTDPRQPNQKLARMLRAADKHGMSENKEIIIRKIKEVL